MFLLSRRRKYATRHHVVTLRPARNLARQGVSSYRSGFEPRVVDKTVEAGRLQHGTRSGPSYQHLAPFARLVEEPAHGRLQHGTRSRNLTVLQDRQRDTYQSNYKDVLRLKREAGEEPNPDQRCDLSMEVVVPIHDRVPLPGLVETT